MVHIDEEQTVPVPAETNAELVYGLSDFATITNSRLREALEHYRHVVRERDGLWYSCCATTCHESREEAEKACAAAFADELAEDADADHASDRALTRASWGAREW